MYLSWSTFSVKVFSTSMIQWDVKFCEKSTFKTLLNKLHVTKCCACWVIHIIMTIFSESNTASVYNYSCVHSICAEGVCLPFSAYAGLNVYSPSSLCVLIWFSYDETPRHWLIKMHLKCFKFVSSPLFYSPEQPWKTLRSTVVHLHNTELCWCADVLNSTH